MTQRLPIPGGDGGQWGDILNGFLKVSHNSDGTLAGNAISGAGGILSSNNLSDLMSVSSARANLGLGSAATQDSSAFDAAGAAAAVQAVSQPAWTVVSKSSTYTTSAWEIVEADTSGGSWTLSLPATPSSGQMIRVKLTGTNTLTVSPNVDGASYTLSTQNTFAEFVYDGTSWKLSSTGAPNGTFLGSSQQNVQTASTQNSMPLAMWHAFLANRFFSRANIVVMGDSLWEGQGASQIAYRGVNRLADALRNRFPISGVTGGQGFLPPQFISSTMPQPAVLAGSPVPAFSGAFGPGERDYVIGVGSGSITWTVTGTSVDVMYTTGPSGGTMGISVDGGTVTTVNTNNASLAIQLKRVSLGSAGSHTVAVTNAGASNGVYVSGLVVYNGDENSGITVHDASHFGITLHNYIAQGAAVIQGWLAQLQPAAVIIALGANDYAGQESLSAFASDLTSLITAIQGLSSPGIPPSIIIHVDYDAFNKSGITWAQYVSQYYAVAAANNCAVFDASLRYPAYSSSISSAGHYTFYTDFVHPNTIGHSMLADQLADFLSPF